MISAEDYSPANKVKKESVESKDMQFLFKDDEFCHFMDVETYNQLTIPYEDIKGSLRFVKENTMVKVCSCDDTVFEVVPQLFVELRVTEIIPEDDEHFTAVVETGERVYVPSFIGVDDVIKIDTRTGEFLTRA